MKTLHIMRKINDPFALAAITDESGKWPTALLLIQDGVLTTEILPEETYVCHEDLSARGAESPYLSINYTGMARLITECGRVITW
ncbi:hypothetical protein MNBD_NITROSPIRAE01-2213 [hydrothermal vent metagenome]|uniref:tRNA 5-methylaminomethyl-2-thiouridine synthase subunit TusB n=1 Tax=hydrothermal vent metagenome TaxID=652676 RepID=A0A3B1DCA7_9ZZZZ